MKLFGRGLFSFKKEPETLWDFAQFGLLISTMQFISIENSGSTVPKKKKEKPVELKITPKGLYYTKALNDNKFAIKIDSAYLDEQIQDAREKLELLGKEKKQKGNGQPMMFEQANVMFGREEVQSIIERLENRRKINQAKNVIEKYPHTTSKLVNDVLKLQDHLRCQRADSFVPDFPKEAINAMKEYNDMCIKLCNKKSVFYVIANKDDFEKRNQRRDPILLAQSPFGFFWSILGAWDSEMIYLGDL